MKKSKKSMLSVGRSACGAGGGAPASTWVVAPVALVKERPASTWGLRSGSRSLDAGFELRVTSYEVRVADCGLRVAGCGLRVCFTPRRQAAKILLATPVPSAGLSRSPTGLVPVPHGACPGNSTGSYPD